jgi:hypothetical protein
MGSLKGGNASTLSQGNNIVYMLWMPSLERPTSTGPSQGGPNQRQKEDRVAALEDGRCCTPSLEGAD